MKQLEKLIILVSLLAFSISVLSEENIKILPSAQQIKALESFNKNKIDIYNQLGADVPIQPSLQSATGNEKNIERYDTTIELTDDVYKLTNEALVLLDSDANSQDIESLIEKYDLKVVDTYPEIGMLRVYSDSKLDQPVPPAILGPTLESQLATEPIVESIVPNTLIAPLSVKDAEFDGALNYADLSVEQVDWGIAQAGINSAWDKFEDHEYVLGIFDVGFYDHDDLLLKSGLPDDQDLNSSNDNHGTHVSGIACGQHNDVGIKGVLPKCTVMYASRSKEFDSLLEDDPLTGFYALFGDIVGTIIAYIDLNKDAVKTINLSLGYNWMPNFNRNPDAPSEVGIRNLVTSQGIIFLRILELAKQHNIVMVSAAGNDSRDLGEPMNAKWASPFNWAALELLNDSSAAHNGIVVEAHDENGVSAVFSNKNGMISAPGVKILSTIGNPENSYKELNGTSMASPYVAAAFQALRTHHPGKEINELLECLLSNDQKSSLGTPMLDLNHSFEVCSI